MGLTKDEDYFGWEIMHAVSDKGGCLQRPSRGCRRLQRLGLCKQPPEMDTGCLVFSNQSVLYLFQLLEKNCEFCLSIVHVLCVYLL